MVVISIAGPALGGFDIDLEAFLFRKDSSGN